MKNKVLRKLMIMGLTCSMTLTMAPVPVIAAAGGAADASRFRGKTVREWEVWGR